MERERPKFITRKMCFDYATDYEFTEEQTDDLCYHMRHMDMDFIEWWNKKVKSKSGKGSKGGKEPPRSGKFVTREG